MSKLVADSASEPPVPAVRRLPQEVLLDIFGHLREDFGCRSQHDAKRCALVCRDWRGPAQQVVFAEVFLWVNLNAQARGWKKSPGRARFRTTHVTMRDSMSGVLDGTVGLAVLAELGDALQFLELQHEARGGWYQLCTSEDVTGEPT